MQSTILQNTQNPQQPPSMLQQLLKSTNEKLKKMNEDKKQTPSLVIPKNLHSVIQSKEYATFVLCLYHYCDCFNLIIRSYNELQKSMKSRMGYDNVILLQKQKDDLAKLQKELSYQYAAILLNYSQKSTYRDQFFFETLIYLVSKVMKDFFTRQEYVFIEQQIHRLFRTNKYNLIKKRHNNDQIMRKFPILKEKANKNKLNIGYILNKVPEQIEAYRKLERLQKKQPQKISRDYTTIMGIHQIKDQEQRSPLLCTWLPSKKSMLNDYIRPSYKSTMKPGTSKQQSF